MTFCERLEQSEFFRSMNGVEESVIVQAENELAVVFANEYKEYLLKYGIASIKGHEFLGLGSSQRLDVVFNTLQLRKDNVLPEDYYAVEDVGIDGIIIAQDCSGMVYEIRNEGKTIEKYESLAVYITQNSKKIVNFQ